MRFLSLVLAARRVVADDFGADGVLTAAEEHAVRELTDFRSKNRTPRMPMILVCKDCHSCLNPIKDIAHVESEHECQQQCFFEGDCRYMSFNRGEQKCQLFEKCEVDEASPETWTRTHKQDPGVLKTLEIPSCTLEPAFRPMIRNYKASCPGVNAADVKMSSLNDLFVNGAQVL